MKEREIFTQKWLYPITHRVNREYNQILRRRNGLLRQSGIIVIGSVEPIRSVARGCDITPKNRAKTIYQNNKKE